MSFSVEIKGLDLSFGSVEVLKNLNLDINDGEFLVLLGSSGCGKSTLLNCIAGLLEITDGQIFIKERNVTWAEPSERGIGMVFQSYALYPQMTVEGNLSFGLKNAKMPKLEIAKRVARAAEILQIEPLLKRKPGALSGGQRQRVAIGRALVRDVDVFLFDEPLSNLDAKLRADLRVELKQLHARLKNTMIYVTHDQVEAMTLADRIAIMKDGSIQQLARPADIYNRPENLYVADFIGSPAMNLLNGQIENGNFEAGDITIPLGGYDFSREARGAAWLGIRPEHVIVGNDSDSADITLNVTAEVVEALGSDTLVLASVNAKRFWLRISGQSQVAPGDALRIGFNASDVSLFDKADEKTPVIAYKDLYMKTSYQLYSSRNFGPLSKTLSMVSELGYAQVEGYGALFADLDDAGELAAALKANNLEMPSAHMGLEMIEQTPDKVIEICRALAIQHVFVPYLDESSRPKDAAGWRAFGERVAHAGTPLIASGVGFGWHNHDFEFTALEDGAMPIDCLFEGAPHLTLEFDIAWCARAGQDPFPWLEKLGERTASVHVKDIAPAGKNMDEDGWADVGAGTVDWAGLMFVLRLTDCGLFIMEHDNPSDDRRFASASINYLNTV